MIVLVGACGGDDSDADRAAVDTGGATSATGDPAGTGPSSEPLEELTITMGGGNSASSVYAFLSAHARLAGEADGAMNIQVRETGAGAENMQLNADGAIDFGMTGLSGLIMAHEGIGQFEGQQQAGARLLMNYIVNAEFIVVRADQGIDTIYDLEGKTIAPSFQGSVTYDAVLAYLNVLGISVKTFDGGLEDIVNAMKDGRIVGFGKSGNGFEADASMLDVASAVPVKAIGFTKDEVDKILAADPEYKLLYQFDEVPPGSIFDNEEPFYTAVIYASYFAQADLPEETAYRLTSALQSTVEDAAKETNYGGAMGVTPELTIASAEIMPLHPGAERWYREAGYL